MTKQQTIELLNQQLPGFYSVDQVIKMINDIETPSSSLSAEKLEVLKDLIERKVSTSIDSMSSDQAVEYDSIELSLNYDNKIEVENCDLITDNIVDQVMEAVEEVLVDFFKEEESEVVVSENGG